MHDLIIVGGGAAGLWAAIVASQRKLKVLVLEKNVKSGVKILMSGGTRCNITHHCGPEQIVEAFGTQGRFLKPAVYALPPSEVVARFNSWGVATKVEDTGKVFPASDRALHVRDALVTQLQLAGAELRTGIAVRDVRRANSTYTSGSTDNHGSKARWEVVLDDAVLPTHNVLLCTGGLSYSACGTTGDGYQWARQVGHTVTPTFPALAPLVSGAGWVHELTGITLADVTVRIISGSKKDKDPRKVCRSSFLWTHFGCSGPAPMNVSRFVSQYEAARAANPELPRMNVELDLLPNLSESDLLTHFDPAKNGRRKVSQLLSDWLPSKIVQLLMQKAGFTEDRAIAELPRKSRLQLLSDLKHLLIPIDSTRGYGKAEVTAGGVDTSEVNSHTLESRLAGRTFLAGEIFDVDARLVDTTSKRLRNGQCSSLVDESC
ncbi:MAG: aminoacetone oxidase family FAD-binding enzyme [Pirellulales bacterium]